MGEETIWEWWPRLLWRWRWRQHFAWLNAQAIRAQERAYRDPWGAEGDTCPCREGTNGNRQPRRRPGALLAVHLRDLERVEEEMRLLILAD